MLFLAGPAKDVKRLSRGKSHSPLTVGITPGRRKNANGKAGAKREHDLRTINHSLTRRTTQRELKDRLPNPDFKNWNKRVLKKKDFIPYRRRNISP